MESTTDTVLTTKIICLALFGVISLCCGLLPLILSRLARCWRRQQQNPGRGFKARLDVLTSCVLCLGGGVLLGTVFTHMMPEIRRVFAQIEEADLLPGMQSPAGEIFLCVGFFLVYLVEELVHTFLTARNQRKKVGSVMSAAPSLQMEQIVGDRSRRNGPPAVQVHGDREAMAWNGRLYRSAVTPPRPASAPASSPASDPDHDHRSEGHDHASALATLQAFRAYIVIIALSVHSVFEGFAVAFETSRRDVWLLFAAIATHKGVVSFCLGEQLVATKRSICFIVTNLALLASASPIGVTLGLLVEQLDTDESSRLVTTGILQSLAAGTILYVVFFEILGPERQKHSHNLLKFFSVLAGFILILLIHSSSGHSHGGSRRLMDGNMLHSGHHQGHVGHAEDVDVSHFNSDYLLRVQGESGHVLDTVRYIQSFRKQEAPAVSSRAIVDNMRSVVKAVGGEQMMHEENHPDLGEFGDQNWVQNHSEQNSVPVSSVNNGVNATHNEPRRTGGGNDSDSADVRYTTDDEASTFVSVDRSVNKDDHMHDEDDPSEHHSNGEEAHHHNHDQFMRTVQFLAGGLADVDPQAVGKTVQLIDRLDLIASQSTHQHAGTSHHPTDASQWGAETTHRHDTEHSDTQNDTKQHQHGSGDRYTSEPDTGFIRPEHADEHVHYVLQDTTPSPLQREGTVSARHSDAKHALSSIAEVQFHSRTEPSALEDGFPATVTRATREGLGRSAPPDDP